MTDIFLGFLNRSLAAGILILAVVLVRLVFKKAPRWLLCALWALAAVRLASYRRLHRPSRPSSRRAKSASVMVRSRARTARSQVSRNTGARPAPSSSS